MKNLFIPYKLAIIAKDKGFDEPCLAHYDLGKLLIASLENNKYKERILAPLYSQIIDWLFEKLISNPDYIEITYCGSKPIEELVAEIEEAFKLI